jgi:integrase
MARKKVLEGPIGNGWVEEAKTDKGVRFVARWKKFVAAPTAKEGRRRVHGGSFEIGPKVYHHNEGLKSLRDAEKKWSEICDSVMGRSQDIHPLLKAERTFSFFANEDPEGFRKRREGRWSQKMVEFYEYLMNRFILPRFGETRLKDIREQDLQALLNELADRDYSQSVVKNTRLYLVAILNEAAEVGILPTNPAARIMRPSNTRKPQRPFLTVEQYHSILDSTESPRDKLMMETLYLTGVRRGELLGLQWRDFDGVCTLNIERQITAKGTIGPAKTDGSVAPIHVPEELAAKLIEYKKWHPKATAENWIFLGQRGSFVNPGHWRRKVLKPIGEKVGIPHLNYPMFRRSCATEMNRQNINDKSIQGQLRHASAAAQREAVERFAKVVAIR